MGCNLGKLLDRGGLSSVKTGSDIVSIFPTIDPVEHRTSPTYAELSGLDFQLSFARELSKILKAMHDSNVTHRDIKPDNLMVGMADGFLILRLIDFGEGSVNPANKAKEFPVGTRLWTHVHILPFRQNNAAPTNQALDYYSALLVLLAVMIGKEYKNRIGEIVTGEDPQNALAEQINLIKQPQIQEISKAFFYKAFKL